MSSQSTQWNKRVDNTFSYSHPTMLEYFLTEETSQGFSRKTANYVKLALNIFRLMAFKSILC